MDDGRVYVLTDKGVSDKGNRWIVCELRDAEDHSCHGVLIFKQLFYMIHNNTVTYRTELSADFPISNEHHKAMAYIMVKNDDIWREYQEPTIEPKPLQYVIE